MGKNKKPLQLLMMIGILVAMLSLGVMRVGAQPNSAECQAIDLVIIVDVSREARDFGGDLYQPILQWFVGLFNYDHLFCPEVTHRVIILPVADQVYYPLDEPVWESLGSADYQKIDQLISSAFSNGQTDSLRDFPAAVRKVSQLSREIPSDRKMVIVLFGARNAVYCGSGEKLDEDCTRFSHSYRVKKLADDLKKAVPEDQDGTPNIFVFGFERGGNYSGEDSDIEREWKRIFADNRGQYFPVNSMDIDLVRTLFNDVFKMLNPNSGMQELAGKFSVPPFVEKLEFYGFRERNRSPVLVKVPGETTWQRISENAVLANKTQADDSVVQWYVYNIPPYGDWEIEHDNWSFFLVHQTLVKNLKESYSPDALVPDFPQYDDGTQEHDPQSPIYLRVQLITQDQKQVAFPDSEKGRKDIEVTGTLLMPDGTQRTLEFVYSATEKVYSTRKPLPVRQEGDYTWNVTMKVIGQPARSLEGSYRVLPVVFYGVKLEEASQRQEIHKNWMKTFYPMTLPLEIRAQVIPVDGGADFQKIEFLGPLSATITHVKTQKSQTIELKHRIGTPENQLTGILETPLTLPGNYVITLSGGESNNGLYRLSETGLSTMEIVREDTFFTSPMAYWGTISFMILVLMILLALWVHSITDPVQGNLVFYRVAAERSFAELDLRKKRRRTLRLHAKDLFDASPILGHVEALQLGWLDGHEGLRLHLKTDQKANFNEEVYHGKRIRIDGGIEIEWKNIEAGSEQ